MHVKVSACGPVVLVIGRSGASASTREARLSDLLPDHAPREALETGMIHSVLAACGTADLPAMRPPYRRANDYQPPRAAVSNVADPGVALEPRGRQVHAKLICTPPHGEVLA
jgi:Magnesium chelatase, subunit ChlI